MVYMKNNMASLYKTKKNLKSCEEHEQETRSFFCKTCKKFICTICTETSHVGHDSDLVSVLAKDRRIEIPMLCRKIRRETMSRCTERMSVAENNISSLERACDDDIKKLEERGSAMIDTISQIIDAQKRKREEMKENESKRMKELSRELRTKIQYLEKMTSRFENNISEYTDHDIIEMDMHMLTVLREIESVDVDCIDTAVKFESGKINEAQLEEMIGKIEQTATNGEVNVTVQEVQTFKEFDNWIENITPVSNDKAWISDCKGNVKFISQQKAETQKKTLPPFNDFTVLNNGDFIIINFDDKVIRRVTSDGKESVVTSSKPLHPTFISKTQTDEILVTLRDGGDYYDIKPSSRRLVQRMTLTGKVLHTYEFREDGTTRLFTFPYRTTQNGNADICVVNAFNSEHGELIVLHQDGRGRASYHGQGGSDFDAPNVACDSNCRIIVSDYNNRSLHLLSPDCIFLRYLLSDMFDNPEAIALYQGCLWVGFPQGEVKMYKYIQ